MRKRQTWIEPPQVSIRETDGAVCLDFSHERKHFLTPQAAYGLLKRLNELIPDALEDTDVETEKTVDVEEPPQGVDTPIGEPGTNAPPIPGI